MTEISEKGNQQTNRTEPAPGGITQLPACIDFCLMDSRELLVKWIHDVETTKKNISVKIPLLKRKNISSFVGSTESSPEEKKNRTSNELDAIWQRREAIYSLLKVKRDNGALEGLVERALEYVKDPKSTEILKDTKKSAIRRWLLDHHLDENNVLYRHIKPKDNVKKYLKYISESELQQKVQEYHSSLHQRHADACHASLKTMYYPMSRSKIRCWYKDIVKQCPSCQSGVKRRRLSKDGVSKNTQEQVHVDLKFTEYLPKNTKEEKKSNTAGVREDSSDTETESEDF